VLSLVYVQKLENNSQSKYAEYRSLSTQYIINTPSTWTLQFPHFKHFLQTTLCAFPQIEALHVAWQGDQTTNIPKTSGGNLRKSKYLWRFSQSCVLHIAGLSNTLYYNWDCSSANEFTVAVEDGNGVPCTRTYIQVGKSTDKVTGQNITVPGGEDNICTK